MPSKAGMRVCASQKENTNFGPVIRSWIEMSALINRNMFRFQKDTNLGNQSLEEGSESFIPGHLGKNLETALGILKVSVLNTSLDHV